MDKKLEENKNQKKIKKENIVWIVGIIVGVLILAAGLFWLAKAGEEPSKKAVFKVGEETVYLDEVNFCILQNVVALGLDREALAAVPESGESADEYYKKEILQVIMDYKVKSQVAEMRGLTLSEEELKSVNDDAVSYVNKMNGSLMRRIGITQDRIVEIYKERYLAHLLDETVTKDIEVEEQRFCTVYMLLFPKVETDENGDYIKQEDGETPVMLPEEAVSQRKAEAEEAYQALLDGADIAEIAEQYGIATVSGEESNTADSFGEPFSEYAKTLKQDEISPVLDTASCYVIMKMVNENNEELANQIYKYYREDLEKEAISEHRAGWYEEAGIRMEPEFVGSVWKKLSLYDFVQYMEDK